MSFSLKLRLDSFYRSSRLIKRLKGIEAPESTESRIISAPVATYSISLALSEQSGGVGLGL